MKVKNNTTKLLLILVLILVPVAGVIIAAPKLKKLINQTATVNVKTVLYLRNEPNSDDPQNILSSYPGGTIVTVTDTTNAKWWKVITPDGLEGYMYSAYLTV